MPGAAEMCNNALQVAQQQPLRKAFDCFQSCVHEQRLYRQRFGPLAQHLASFCKRRLSSTWSRWRQHTKCSHLHRTGRLRMMTRTLKVWRERNVHRKSLKAAVKGIAARRNRRLSSSYLQNWYSAARKCRLSDWMLRWRCAVASSQTQQVDLAKAFFRKRLLQRAFGHWEMSLHCGQLRGWSLKVPRFSSRFRTRLLRIDDAGCSESCRAMIAFWGHGILSVPLILFCHVRDGAQFFFCNAQTFVNNKLEQI